MAAPGRERETVLGVGYSYQVAPGQSSSSEIGPGRKREHLAGRAAPAHEDEWVELYGFQGMLPFRAGDWVSFSLCVRRLLSLPEAAKGGFHLLHFRPHSRELVTIQDDEALTSANGTGPASDFIAKHLKQHKLLRCVFFVKLLHERPPGLHQPTEAQFRTDILRLKLYNPVEPPSYSYVSYPKHWLPADPRISFWDCAKYWPTAVKVLVGNGPHHANFCFGYEAEAGLSIEGWRSYGFATPRLSYLQMIRPTLWANYVNWMKTARYPQLVKREKQMLQWRQQRQPETGKEETQEIGESNDKEEKGHKDDQEAQKEDDWTDEAEASGRDHQKRQKMDERSGQATLRCDVLVTPVSLASDRIALILPCHWPRRFLDVNNDVSVADLRTSGFGPARIVSVVRQMICEFFSPRRTKPHAVRLLVGRDVSEMRQLLGRDQPNIVFPMIGDTTAVHGALEALAKAPPPRCLLAFPTGFPQEATMEAVWVSRQDRSVPLPSLGSTMADFRASFANLCRKVRGYPGDKVYQPSLHHISIQAVLSPFMKSPGEYETRELQADSLTFYIGPEASDLDWFNIRAQIPTVRALVNFCAPGKWYWGHKVARSNVWGPRYYNRTFHAESAPSTDVGWHRVITDRPIQYQCPFPGCRFVYSISNSSSSHSLEVHATQYHAVRRCPWCDEALFDRWTARQIDAHLSTHHEDRLMSALGIGAGNVIRRDDSGATPLPLNKAPPRLPHGEATFPDVGGPRPPPRQLASISQSSARKKRQLQDSVDTQEGLASSGALASRGGPTHGPPAGRVQAPRKRPRGDSPALETSARSSPAGVAGQATWAKRGQDPGPRTEDEKEAKAKENKVPAKARRPRGSCPQPALASVGQSVGAANKTMAPVSTCAGIQTTDAAAKPEAASRQGGEEEAQPTRPISPSCG